MMHLEATPDLDTPPGLLIAYIVAAWALLGLVYLIGARRARARRAGLIRQEISNDHERLDAAGDTTGPALGVAAEDARAAGSHPARLARGVRGDRGDGDGLRLHRGRRADGSRHPVTVGLELDDAELIALAHYLDRTVAVELSRRAYDHAVVLPLLSAELKVERAASNVLHADRISRRG